jgi:hypothetical protein
VAKRETSEAATKDSGLEPLSVGELLALSRRVLAELRRRGAIRSGNAPAGDYAEVLVERATNGELAPNSQRSWDVLTPEDERLQERLGSGLAITHRTVGVNASVQDLTP